MLFREIGAFIVRNTQTHPVWVMQILLVLQHVVHIVTAGFWNVEAQRDYSSVSGFRRIYFRLLFINLRSRDSSVSVVTKPLTGQKTIRVWFPAVFTFGNKIGNYTASILKREDGGS